MSDDQEPAICIAFEGVRRIAEGPRDRIAGAVRDAIAREREPVLVFDAATSTPVEIAPHGAPQVPVRPPGRPKLGVTAREVTLLPRHWEWLAGQPGGASVALRRLVDEARRRQDGAERLRAAQDATYRFISVMAGNLAGYEDALRALYRKDRAGFEEMTRIWPDDVAEHARRLAAPVFET